MSNDLTIAVLDNKSVSVPIGRTVLTNIKSQNSLKVQAAQTGAEVVAPIFTAIVAPGYDGEQAYRTDADVVYFDTPVDRNALRIAEIVFDDKTGVLTFYRKNGSHFEVTSFLRQIDFGVGPAGTRGDPGKDGTMGEDGIDGKDGTVGCAGVQGIEGRPGPQGDPGKEGEVGSAGPYGPLGPTGPRGDVGATGVPGFEGKRGLCGFSCPTTSRGPCGPQGKTMSGYVQTGPYPKNNDLIWAAAEDCTPAHCPATFDLTDVGTRPVSYV